MKIQWMTTLVVMVAFAGSAQAGVFTSGNYDINVANVGGTPNGGGGDENVYLSVGGGGTAYTNSWGNPLGNPLFTFGTSVRTVGFSPITGVHTVVGGGSPPDHDFAGNKVVAVFALGDPSIPGPNATTPVGARFTKGVMAVYDLGPATTLGSDPSSWVPDLNNLSTDLLAVFKINPGDHTATAGVDGFPFTSDIPGSLMNRSFLDTAGGDTNAKTMWEWEEISPTDFFDYGATSDPALFVESNGTRQNLSPDSDEIDDADTLFSGLYALGGLAPDSFLSAVPGGDFNPFTDPGGDLGDEISTFEFNAFPGSLVIPEPSSIVAWVILGLVGALTYRRRKK